MSENNTIVEEPKEEVKGTKEDKIEESARYIHILHGQFRQHVYKVANRKKRAPVRVLEALLFQGLHDTELIGKEEKELLALCSDILYHKSILSEYAYERLTKKEKENEDERKEE